MIDPLPAVLIGAGLLLAVLATAFVVLDRPIGRVLLVALAVLEAGLLVQTVLGMVELAGTDRDVNGWVFVGYLLGTLLFVPVAAFSALGERSRAGTSVLIVVGLVVPVLVLRAQQVWDGAGA
jgi:hypothetical protein